MDTATSTPAPQTELAHEVFGKAKIFVGAFAWIVFCGSIALGMHGWMTNISSAVTETRAEVSAINGKVDVIIRRLGR